MELLTLWIALYSNFVAIVYKNFPHFYILMGHIIELNWGKCNMKHTVLVLYLRPICIHLYSCLGITTKLKQKYKTVSYQVHNTLCLMYIYNILCIVPLTWGYSTKLVEFTRVLFQRSCLMGAPMQFLNDCLKPFAHFLTKINNNSHPCKCTMELLVRD